MKIELQELIHELESEASLIGKSYILKRLNKILEGEVHRYRGVSGAKNYSAILTGKEVVAMRKMFAEGATHDKIAEKFCVGRSTVGRIIRRQAWKHI